MIRLGVTGTDTGVGKTVVACALASCFRRRGRTVATMKPIETGVEEDDGNRDAARLARAGGGRQSARMVGPITFPTPAAPLVAARRAGVAVDLAALERAVGTISASADVLIVEGAGGLLVPITSTIAFDALFRQWSLALVIVAANRLGALNHAMLTVAAARAAGLPVRCIVLNHATRDHANESDVGNAATLRELLPDIPVVELPWITDLADLDALADAAEQYGLAEVLDTALTL
jgi:dethiobiotin synthetase